jgi:hypothetical protein
LTNVFQTVFQWNIIDFEFPPGARQAAIRNRQFIPENNVPLGIAATFDRVFVTTPRWLEGVPVSLSSIQLPSYSDSPRLTPYPNWEEHTSPDNPDCTKLMSVYRVYIDECNRLWVIDSGIINALSNLNQVCLPKVVAFDLTTNRKLWSYEFPADQVKQDSLHTNLLVDIRNGQCNSAFIYVSDVWRNGLLVIDMQAANSWRTTNYLYNPNPHASDFTYKGLNFQWSDGIFGTSLGRIFDDRVLYFHPMSSHNEFSVRTSVLRNRTAWENPFSVTATDFISIGTRGPRSQSSTSDIDLNEVQYFTLVQKEGIACWNTRKSYNRANIHVLEQDPVKIGFPNDLKLDDAKANIWVVSNNLPIFLYSRLNYSEINFRLIRASVNSIIGTACDPNVPEADGVDDICEY